MERLTKLFAFTLKANSAAGSQEQDGPNLFEDFPLPTQEVNGCGFVETQEVNHKCCIILRLHVNTSVSVIF